MREILFRGKTSNGEWEYGVPVFSGLNNELAFMKQMHSYDHQVIPETVGQYTGLTDKNGKKIFEGDIVQYTDEECYYPEENCDFVGRISLEHGAFGIVTNDNIPIDLNDWCDDDNFVSLWELYWNLSVEGEILDMIEIIGNIHDNPELLKECEGK